jgi:DNA-binding transcriptional ArsR family regulator
MVYYRDRQIDDVFFALSHPVRRAVLERLAKEDLSVSELSAPLGESASQMTKHLHILERSGLLKRTREGRIHKLHLEPTPLQEIWDWVSHYRQFWEGKFDALEKYLHKISE